MLKIYSQFDIIGFIGKDGQKEQELNPRDFQ